MTLWRLEWFRLWRTKRWMVLLGVYLLFGLFGPLTVRYVAEIVSLAGGGEGADLAAAVPAAGMARYVSNAMQIGTLVVVVVAAGAMAFDAIPEMGVFLRTRVKRMSEILVPRFAVMTAAVLSSFLAGTVVAWFTTWASIGSPGTGEVVAGLLYGSLFLVFVIALVGAVAGRVGSVLGTVIVTVVVLVLLPTIGGLGGLGDWLPAHLTGALAALPAGETAATDYLRAAAVTVAASGLLVWLSMRLAQRREL